MNEGIKQFIIHLLNNSSTMLTINLNNLRFYSFHGLHEEERVLGNEYEVNVSISIEAKERIVSLEQTVNYVAVYKIIQQQMEKPNLLLEQVAHELAGQIHGMHNKI